MNFAKPLAHYVTAGRNAAALRGVLALAASVFLAACCCHAPAAPSPPPPSQPLPDVTFKTAQNEAIAMADFKGRVIFVDFWATNCKDCAAMRTAAERLYKHAAADTWFMGVNEDEQRQTWKTYMEGHFSALSEVWDEGHSFRRALGWAGQPSAVLVDRSGRVRWRCDRWTGATEAEAAEMLGKLERETAPQ
jgi:thiol-disulfide isomerase/thioredoxin